MGLDEKYESGFLAQVDASRRGETTYLPLCLDRVNNIINLMQSRYTVVFGATGCGKTSWADLVYILSPFTYLKQNEPDVHWEALYFSLERKQEFKHAKWISWFMYRDHGLQIPADKLMWGKPPLNDKGYTLLRSYDDEISELLEHVRIYDGKVPISTLEKSIHSRARALGVLFHTDDTGLMQDDSPVYILRFDEDGRMKRTKTGDRLYLQYKYKDKEFTLYEYDHRYFPHKPKTFVFIVVDGIGLFGSSDFAKKKSSMDEVSSILANARDLYGFSPVVISQINRELSSVGRQRLHGNDLSPQLSDIQGSSQVAHDSDVVFGLFDPYEYKALDNAGFYGGYDILGCMLHPHGFSRFRSLHLLKNSFGYASKVFGLKFMGESNEFSTLPLPDSDEIDQIYVDIALGK